MVKEMAGWVLSFCFLLVVNGVGVHASEDLQPYRTAFHFQPLKNWMNDPNGPMYFNGIYHLFYQYNPGGPLWGNISWGHSISHDLVNWFILEPALSPKEPYDIGGCFTGSSTILHGSKPIILYTAQDVDGTQVQNLAFPKNRSDPLLKDWIKWSGNPILTPVNDINTSQFRDPSTAWKGPGGKWRIVIGSEIIKGQATVLLYYSTDGFNWTRSDKPLHFSRETNMWECPDFYPVSNIGKDGIDTSFQGNNTMHVLKVSFNSHDYYVIGTYDPKMDQFLVVTNDFSVSTTQFQYDYGRFYASKSFYDGAKKRRVLWGWVNEGDSPSDAFKKGWSGLQSFPRSIWLSDTRKQLVQWPVEEIKKLRAKQVSMESRELKGGSLFEVPGISGSQVDHSIVESFGGEGLACITARVYPKLAIHENAKLYVFNNGTKSVTTLSLNAWNMNKAQIVPID